MDRFPFRYITILTSKSHSSFALGYANAIVCPPINHSSKTTVCLNDCTQMQMGSMICSVVSRGASSSCCYALQTGKSGTKFVHFSNSKTRPSSIGQTSYASCFKSFFSKEIGNSQSLTVNAGGPHKRCFDISFACHGMKTRLLVSGQGMLPKIKCNVRRVSWPQGCTSSGLLFGLLVCNCAESAPAQAAHKDNKEENSNLSYVKFSHGKKVYTDYSIIGE